MVMGIHSEGTIALIAVTLVSAAALLYLLSAQSIGTNNVEEKKTVLPKTSTDLGGNEAAATSRESKGVEQKVEKRFAVFGLKTNTAKSTVDLGKVLSGGPGKDGIPAITNPKFTTVAAKSDSIKNDTRGVVVGKAQPKFYPYNILAWHEIVDDEVDGIPVAVTFCPLCGTALVFDRRVGNDVLEFRVSGLLYQSNLLMYDTKTESLWSQAQREAVVGDFTGRKLELVPSSVLTFEEFAKQHPNGLVMSDQTGHIRIYTFYPYGDYDTSDDFFFPVGDYGKELPPKELVFAVPTSEGVGVFQLEKLNSRKEAEMVVGQQKIFVKVQDGEIIAIVDGEETAGYYSMYFSVTLHNKNVVVWKP